MEEDTIFAVATASGRAGIAIVRLSGPGAATVLGRIAGHNAPVPRRATRARLRHPDTGDPLDDALFLWFPAPASLTGEDVVELHLHGGRAVVEGVLEALSGLDGLRPAEPGEFSRRAFDHGKFDLTAAEGLADLIAAETPAQRRQALGQLNGALTRLYDGWRTRLVQALAHLEATIDFSDEDLPETVEATLRNELKVLKNDISTHLEDGRRGERLRNGLRITLVGPPNSGKSSLLNALARRDAAIVSASPGTTRDPIDVHLDSGGFPVILTDTAGLRETAEEVESEGIRRTLARAEDSDLKLIVLDGVTWPAVDAMTLALMDEDAILVVNKTDLLGNAETFEVAGRRAMGISVRTGQGLEGLVYNLEKDIAARWTPRPEPALSRIRHRLALQDCRDALSRALVSPLADLMAEDVRLAARALGRITGRVDVEQVLDVIFRDFCIGK